jgi:hypothetical protein
LSATLDGIIFTNEGGDQNDVDHDSIPDWDQG